MSGTPKATVGVDFGTESARAILVDVGTGRELGTAVKRYASGVIDQHLPGHGATLAPDWALQDPDDYLDALGSTVRDVLAETGIDPSDVIGIGIDFTACTMLPVTKDGTPLCRIPELRADPHSWVKLWKHHAAQPEADLINETAETRVAQLNTALRTRVIIEQAKGFLAARHDIEPDEAFERLRRYSRNHHLVIHEVARQVVARELDLPG